MDEKTKQKQDEIIEMVSSFCQDKLNEEYEELSIKLVEKMGRKHNVPFKRGRLDIWASAVIYALAQVNFLFDKSSEYHISADDICDYFGTKKSTVSSKASKISDMFNLSPFDKEFSSRDNIIEMPHLTLDDNGFIVPASEMDIFFDEVYDLFENGNVDEALDKLDTIKEDNPEYPRALFYKSIMLADSDDNRAGELFMQSLIGEAIRAQGDDFIDEDSDYQDYFNKGVYEYDSGNYEEALYLFNVSLGLKPNQSEALYYKAITLGCLFEFDEALEVIDRAIDLDCNDDRFWNDKANFLTRLNQMDEAIKCFDRASELNPTDSIIMANKGFMYLQMEDYENAIESYKKACELETNIHNLVGLANAYVEIYDFPNAEKYFTKASKIDDDDMEYLTAMAHFMMYQEKLEESLKYWDRILEIYPNRAEVWVYKSFLYLMMNNKSEAGKCIEKACEIDIEVLGMFEDLLDEEFD